MQATITRLAKPAPRADVPAELVDWEQHTAQVARHQLDLYLRHSASALRQSTVSFQIGMTAASLGFLAILGSLAWLLATDRDIGWLGVVSGGVCEAVAALFFAETRATRARTAAMFDRVQAEADRVVRARGAMSVIQSIDDPATKEALIADVGRWLLGAETPAAQVRQPRVGPTSASDTSAGSAPKGANHD